MKHALQTFCVFNVSMLLICQNVRNSGTSLPELSMLTIALYWVLKGFCFRAWGGEGDTEGLDILEFEVV